MVSRNGRPAKLGAYKVVEELLTDWMSAGHHRSVPSSPPVSAGMSNTNSALQKSADTVARAVFKAEKGRRIYSASIYFGEFYWIAP